MKSYLILSAILMLSTICRGQKSLSRMVMYDVPVKMDSTFGSRNRQPVSAYTFEEEWYENKLLTPDRMVFLRSLHDSVLNGRLKVYQLEDMKDLTEPVFTPVTPEMASKIGNDSVFVLIYNPEKNDEEMVGVRRTFDLQKIYRIRFLEEWTYDPRKMTIVKKIIAYAPLYRRELGSSETLYDIPMYWVVSGK